MARYKLTRALEVEGKEQVETLNKGSLLYIASKAYEFQKSLEREHYKIELDETNELNFTALLRDSECDDDEGDIIASIRYEISRVTKADEVRPKFDPKTARAPKPSKADEKKKAKKEKKEKKRLKVLQTGKTVNGTEKAFTNNPVLYEGGAEEVSTFCESYCNRMVDSGADVEILKHGFVVKRKIAAGELTLTYEIKAA